MLNFEDFGLIRKMAWSFHNTTGIDFEELVGEASLAYCKALKTYDPTRGKLSTHVWWYMRDELINFVRKEKQYAEMTAPIQSTHHTSSTPQFLFESLSKEAQEVARVVFRTPKKFLELPTKVETPTKLGKPPRSCAEKRVIQLLLQQGFPYHKILIGLKDLKLALT